MKELICNILIKGKPMGEITGNIVLLIIGIIVVLIPKLFLRKDQKYTPTSTNKNRIKNIRYVGIAIIVLGIILTWKNLFY
jgi:hypothetical protein